jgi:tRNA pseudouridine65 synthase
VSLGDLRVLHEDEDVFAIDKPSGLAVHPGYARERDTVVARLAAARSGPVHLLHRLDRGTSGVLLVAQTPAAAARFGAAFRASRVDKTYLAIVRGSPPAEALVDHAIPVDEGGPRADAVTLVRTIAVVQVEGSPLRETRYALVEAAPRTGRFHQVRRHLKHLGHPIVGDTNYGKSEHDRFVRERFGLARLALHAARIIVRDEDGRALVDVASPLADDMRETAVRMGLG